MSVEDVRSYFTKRGYKDPVFSLDESGATVEMASKAIGVAPELIAKTLAFQVKDKYILIITSGNCRIDNKKYKQYFKVKAKMLDHDTVQGITGHPVGGVCPFGLKNDLDIYLDISIKNHEYVYPAAGSQNTALKIAPQDIENLTHGKWVDVCII